MSRQQRYRFKMARLFGPDADAQAIGELIEELIATKNEHVTYEELIAAGRASASPLHVCFTFDENLAADKWRRREAKLVIKQLYLADKKQPKQAGKTRAFAYVNHPEHGGKRVLLTMSSAMHRPEFARQVVRQAVRALQRSLTYWGHAYGGNPEMSALAKDVEKLSQRAERQLLAAVA